MRLVKPSYEIMSPIEGAEILRTIELAGRVCYKSESRITDASAEKFVRMIVKSGHMSVIEHISLTVRFVIDRGVSHELVRHRLCSFSQSSTRYCNYGKGEGQVAFIIPLWTEFQEGIHGVANWLEVLDCKSHTEADLRWWRACYDAECAYLNLLKRGWSPQQARSVLPNSLKTEVVTTANLREWRHIFDLRCSKAAHPQIREVMIPLRDELRERVPIVFD